MRFAGSWNFLNFSFLPCKRVMSSKNAVASGTRSMRCRPCPRRHSRPFWFPSGLRQKPGLGSGGGVAPHALPPAQVVRYEAGYVVCAVVAGLYLLLVPAAGLCFCCCRRRRRCGGRVKTEHKALACECVALTVFLLLTTLLLL